jgi:pimeloyl-ACP methyl ester carboxylesterase
MQRFKFPHDKLVFSYLDSGGEGPTVIALHAHWMEAATFTPLAAALSPEWRLVALDQRGHGFSDHASSYTRDDYLGDLEALFGHLRIDEAVLLGNSLGGINAFQFAARYPGRVAGLIVEDIGADLSADLSFVLPWAGTFPTREALEERIGTRLLPYLSDSFRHVQGGWRLPFEPADMLVSQRHLNGDHWKDWLASACPALLIRGRGSHLTTQHALEKMAALRPNTSLVTLEGGHVVHSDNLRAFADCVRDFLRGL